MLSAMLHVNHELAPHVAPLVSVQLKPSLGVFAVVDVPKNTRFPVVSPHVLIGDRGTKAVFHLSATTHVMAVKPIKPQPMGKATIVGDRTGTCSGWCNVASAIRLVSDEEAQQSKLLTMCDMGLCPVVHAMSYSGVAHETVTHVVVITARQHAIMTRSSCALLIRTSTALTRIVHLLQ